MKYELFTTAELPDFDALRGYVGKSNAVVVSGLSGNPGLFSFDPTDTSSADDGTDLIVGNNGKRWVRLPGPGEFQQSGDGAVTRTFNAKARDHVSILDFIPVAEHAAIRAGTSTYDIYSDLIEAIESVTMTENSTYITGPAVYFPPGKYICNTTVQLKRAVRLYGDYSGLPFASTAKIKFPAGVTAFIVHAYNTTGATVESPATTAGSATCIEGLLIEGTLGTADSYGGHGVWLRSKAIVRNCTVGLFAGNGINVVAAAGGGGSLEGNANNFQIRACRVVSNTGHGIYVDGADANAGLVDICDCSNNDGWGIYDSSFLGNTYVACHADANTLGPYKTDGANGRNVFLGCYSESGQPAADLVSPTLVLGGLHAAGFTSGSTHQYVGDGTINSYTSTNTVGADTISGWYGARSDIASVLSFAVGTTSSSDIYRLQYDSTNKAWHYQHANSSSRRALSFTTTSHAQGPGYPYFSNGYFWFDGTNYIYSGTATAAPSTGTYARGSFLINRTPSAGSPLGWICTTAGTPGTWATVGEVIGAGGTVTQATSKTTGVTLNTRTGQITMEATTSIAAGATVRFALTNSTIGANDVITVVRKSGGTNSAYQVWTDGVASGSCGICVQNITAGALAEAVVLQFRVVSGAIA